SSVPLLMFAAGARRIPLSLVGLLQYISPTLQLLLGVLVWREPFNAVKLVGYALIWLALMIYSADGAWAAQRRRRGGAGGSAGLHRGERGRARGALGAQVEGEQEVTDEREDRLLGALDEDEGGAHGERIGRAERAQESDVTQVLH